MRVYGLIGYPLEHSFSPSFFSSKFQKENIYDAQYKAFPLKSIEDLPALLQAETSVQGLNVTVPYKKSVLPFLNSMDESVCEIGAANVITIRRTEDETFLHGSNTDVIGFRKSLGPILRPYHTGALILGSGGSAAAVAYVFQELGISYTIVGRNGAEGIISYEVLDEKIISANLLIVNTTPLGMFPNIQEYPPIPYRAITSSHLVFDMVYNPEETIFLKKAKQQGAQIMNGLEMLSIQAEESWRLWNKL